MAAGIWSATQEWTHSVSKSQADDPGARICCEGKQIHSESRSQVLRIGVFSRYSEIMEINASVGTDLSGWGPRCCHGLAGRHDNLLWALSLHQTRLFSCHKYGASSAHVTNPSFLLEGPEREHEDVSLISSDNLQKKTKKVISPQCVCRCLIVAAYSGTAITLFYLSKCSLPWFRKGHKIPPCPWAHQLP